MVVPTEVVHCADMAALGAAIQEEDEGMAECALPLQVQQIRGLFETMEIGWEYLPQGLYPPAHAQSLRAVYWIMLNVLG